jgi:IS605 OrfB family transposase
LVVRKVRKSRVRKGRGSPGKKSDSGESSGHLLYSLEKREEIHCYDAVKMVPAQPEEKERILSLMKENNWAENRILKTIGKNRKLAERVAEDGIPEDLYRKLFSTLSSYGVPDWIIKGAFKGATTIIGQWHGSTNLRGHVPKVKALRLHVPTEWYNPETGYLELPPVGLKLRAVGSNWKCKGYPIVPGWVMLVYRPEYEAFFLMLLRKVPPRKRKFNRPLSYVKELCCKRGWVLSGDVNSKELVVSTGDKEKEKRYPMPIKELEPYRNLLMGLRRNYSGQGSYVPLERRRGLKRRVWLTRRKMTIIARQKLKEIAKEVIDYAWFLGSETEEIPYCIVMEDLRGLQKRIREDKDIPKEVKDTIKFIPYYWLEKWIIILAKRNGVPYERVDPRGTSTTCPKCGVKLVEVGHRRLKCPVCGLEEDRDTIAVMNLRKRFLSSCLRSR